VQLRRIGLANAGQVPRERDDVSLLWQRDLTSMNEMTKTQ